MRRKIHIVKEILSFLLLSHLLAVPTAVGVRRGAPTVGGHEPSRKRRDRQLPGAAAPAAGSIDPAALWWGSGTAVGLPGGSLCASRRGALVSGCGGEARRDLARAGVLTALGGAANGRWNPVAGLCVPNASKGWPRPDVWTTNHRRVACALHRRRLPYHCSMIPAPMRPL